MSLQTTPFISGDIFPLPIKPSLPQEESIPAYMNLPLGKERWDAMREYYKSIGQYKSPEQIAEEQGIDLEKQQEFFRELDALPFDPEYMMSDKETDDFLATIKEIRKLTNHENRSYC